MKNGILHILYIIIFTFIANSYALIERCPWSLLGIIPAFLFINIFAGVFSLKTENRRMNIYFHGGKGQTGKVRFNPEFTTS